MDASHTTRVTSKMGVTVQGQYEQHRVLLGFFFSLFICVVWRRADDHAFEEQSHQCIQTSVVPAQCVQSLFKVKAIHTNAV